MKSKSLSAIELNSKLVALLIMLSLIGCGENNNSLSLSQSQSSTSNEISHRAVAPDSYFTKRQNSSINCLVSRNDVNKNEPLGAAEYLGGESAGGAMSRTNTIASVNGGVITIVEETSFANIPAKLSREFKLDNGLIEISGKSLDGAWSYENTFKENVRETLESILVGEQIILNGTRKVEARGKTKNYNVQVRVKHLGCLHAEKDSDLVTTLVSVSYLYNSLDFPNHPVESYSRIYEIFPNSWFPVADQQESDVFKSK